MERIEKEAIEPRTKRPYDSSSRESNVNLEAGLIGNGTEFGLTDSDFADMQRLGKTQEFNVSFAGNLPLAVVDIHLEKLRTTCYFRIYFNLYGNLGICSCVSTSLS
jgi:hypothetical protein